MIRRAGLVAVAAGLVALAPSADAELPPRYDPALHFRTVETPHFRVHFHAGGEALAQRTARLAERAHRLVTPLLGHAPTEPTQILLVDYDDRANGWAISTPYNVIELLAVPPDPRSVLNDFDDWLWLLVAHEYTHVVHMDTVRGLAHVGNRVFGKMLSPNAAWPRWFVEGLAVWMESLVSSGGRVRSSLHDMELRMHLLEGRAFDLGVLSNPPLTWPRRDAWYLYGGRFLDYLARRFGPGVLRDVSLANAATVVPYLLDQIAEERTGQRFDILFAAFLAEQRERYEMQQKAIGAPSPQRFLTGDGEIRRTPRLSPDGGTLYSLKLDADGRPTVRALELATARERVVAEVNGDGALAVLPDGRLLLGQPDVHRQFNSFEDLFLLDPATGAFDPVTRGARLSDPDVDRAGRIVCVGRPGQARTALLVADSLDDLRAGRLRAVHEAPEGELVASPRFSPDGRSIVFLEHRGGGFDLRRLDLATGRLDDLTRDGAQDLAPAFSADGRRVFFSSDRTGIYDVYELDLDTRETRRHTRVIGGAFDPIERDGTLHFVGYRALGYDLVRHDAALAPEPAPAAPPPRPSPPVDADSPAPYPVRDYAPFDTLRPAWWLPVVGADPGGPTVGATTLGFDVTGRWSWSAGAWWGLATNQPGFAASVRTDALWPALSLQGRRSVELVPGAPEGYLESSLSGRLNASFLFRRQWSAWRVDVSWQLAALAPAAALPPGSPPPPAQGLLGTGILTLEYSSVRRWIRSISSEEGRRLSLEVRESSAWLGSDFASTSASASWAEFVKLPWSAHHVLALRVTGGAGVGALGNRRIFGLGGPSSWSLLSDAATLQSPTRLLRGYGPNTFTGRAFALATAEYRFPLADLERGFGVLPVFLRRLHGAVFVDAGDAFDPGTSPVPRLGVGAELRTELTFGYLLSGDLRLGYARGLSAGGGDQLLLLAGTHF